MKFTKMHGCGNDYVYVDCTGTQKISDASEVARKVSDRHFGIGSDGLILIKRGKQADFEMEMYNADGSRSAMCGNGIRCVAKYIFDHNLFSDGISKTCFTIESMGAVKYITIVSGRPGDKVCCVRVDMGTPALQASKIPVALNKPARDVKNSSKKSSENSAAEITADSRIIKYPLTVGEKEYKITCVSMGNPHTVVFIEKKPAEFDVCGVGPLFENNAFFPERTNTEFAFVEDRQTIWMRVWERGTGETWACGTGTCATVVAAIVNNLVDAGKKITVHLLGGNLEIEWSGKETDSVFMTGPAETVFDGEFEI